MTSLSLEEQDVLLSAHEQSDLYEVVGSLDGVPSTGTHLEGGVDRARRIISVFLGRGWIRLFAEHLRGDRRLGDMSDVPASEFETIANDPPNWDAPARRPESEITLYGIATTPSGEALIRDGVINAALARIRQRDAHDC